MLRNPLDLIGISASKHEEGATIQGGGFKSVGCNKPTDLSTPGGLEQRPALFVFFIYSFIFFSGGLGIGREGLKRKRALGSLEPDMHSTPISKPTARLAWSPPCNLQSVLLSLSFEQTRGPRDESRRRNDGAGEQELYRRYMDGMPQLDPLEDMGISGLEPLVQAIAQLENQLAANPVFKACVPRSPFVPHSSSLIGWDKRRRRHASCTDSTGVSLSNGGKGLDLGGLVVLDPHAKSF